MLWTTVITIFVLFQVPYLPDVTMTDIGQTGVQVLQLSCTLGMQEVESLDEMFNPTAPSLCFGADIYTVLVNYVESILELQQEP